MVVEISEPIFPNFDHIHVANITSYKFTCWVRIVIRVGVLPFHLVIHITETVAEVFCVWAAFNFFFWRFKAKLASYSQVLIWAVIFPKAEAGEGNEYP